LNGLQWFLCLFCTYYNNHANSRPKTQHIEITDISKNKETSTLGKSAAQMQTGYFLSKLQVTDRLFFTQSKIIQVQGDECVTWREYTRSKPRREEQ